MYWCQCVPSSRGDNEGFMKALVGRGVEGMEHSPAHMRDLLWGILCGNAHP